MSISIHKTEKPSHNIIISNSQGYQPNDEIVIKIDETNQLEVRAELDRLRKLVFTEQKPNREDYCNFDGSWIGGNNKAYTEAKAEERNRVIKLKKQYKKRYDYLDALNTNLCFENKAKKDEQAKQNGTFYNGDELEYLNIKKELRQLTQSKYYEKNREKLLLKKKLKYVKATIKQTKEDKKNADKSVQHLFTARGVIKPMCICGRQCDVVKNLRKHSTLEKHQLFKSIIRMIHYKRRYKSIKPVIDTINYDYMDAKRVVREKINGKSFTVTNKTDKEIIKEYNNFIDDITEDDPMDESVTHKPRKSYINKKKYTQDYKNNVELMSYCINGKIK